MGVPMATGRFWRRLDLDGEAGENEKRLFGRDVTGDEGSISMSSIDTEWQAVSRESMMETLMGDGQPETEAMKKCGL